MKGTISASARSGLRDACGRRIGYLRVSVTDRCDMACLYCRPPGGATQEAMRFLPDEQLVRVIRVAVGLGLRKVRLSGGEPLLRPGIVSLVRRLKAETGLRELSLTTNGNRLAEFAPALRWAGLDRVNVSLDSLDPDRFRRITRGGHLERVLEGIEAAESVGLRPLKINMVPLRGENDDEISAFARLTLDRDIHVRFIERMPVRTATAGERPVLLPEIRRWVEEVGRLRLFPFRGLGPSRNFRIEGARGVVGFISPMSQHFCDSCTRLRLTARGRLRPCLLSAGSHDLASLLNGGGSDADIARLFTDAVRSKPPRHGLNENDMTPVIESMNRIGG